MEIEPTEATPGSESGARSEDETPSPSTTRKRRPRRRRTPAKNGNAANGEAQTLEAPGDAEAPAVVHTAKPDESPNGGTESDPGETRPATNTRRRSPRPRRSRRKNGTANGAAVAETPPTEEFAAATERAEEPMTALALPAETAFIEPAAPPFSEPDVEPWPEMAPEIAETPIERAVEFDAVDSAAGAAVPGSARRGRRRRRRGRGGRSNGARPAESPLAGDHNGPNGSSAVAEPPVASPSAPGEPAAEGPRKSRRRRRGGRSRRGAQPAEAATSNGTHVAPSAAPLPEHAPVPHAPPRLVAHVDDEDEPEDTGPHVKREMIINVSAGEECRVAILEEGRLEELHLERQSAESHVGNIYKGRVTNVEPSIQAAFVDFGMAKNGFLHISDVQPRYFPDGQNEPENVGKKVPRRDRPPIHKCFRRGQEVIVQITKEGVGTKGPTLTTYLSIPGRYLVMMPGMSRLGVSRRIEDEDSRYKMRSVLNELSLPEGMGFILRTAGLDKTKRDLQRDLNYLKRLWKVVEDRIHQMRAPAELYQESDLVIRTIRDLYTPDFDRVIIDHEPTAVKARDFMQVAMPRSPNVIELYTAPEPIFYKYGIEAEIERINARHVPLSSGGSIVIDSTEAMVAIDVNSGKFRALDDAEETAFQINVEAAKEIARQLRLRDLGGIVVCDFIDMRMDRHKRVVERTLRDELKKHKERARILRMSQFGLIEMTRQRQRTSIKRSIYSDCPHCRGSGVVKNLETMVLEVVRILQLAAHKSGVAQITMRVAPDVALAVLNQRRPVLYKLEQETSATITIHADPTLGIDHVVQEFRDERGRSITLEL